MVCKGSKCQRGWASGSEPDLREQSRFTAPQLLVVRNDLVVRRGFFFFFWLHILWDLTSPIKHETWANAVTILSLDHWTTREFPGGAVLSIGPPVTIVYHV